MHRRPGVSVALVEDDGDAYEDLIKLHTHFDEDAVWQWFHDHLPRCAALVPSKRRSNFVEGVRGAFEEGWV